MDAQFNNAGKYYLITYLGLRTLATMTELLESVKKNAETTGVYRYLFDLRHSEEGFSVLDKYKFGHYLADLFQDKYTVAVVIRKEHITGFLGDVARNRGAKRFRITDDETEALLWLKKQKSPPP